MSEAYGVSGNQQVGFGTLNTTGRPAQALLWSGTAASAVNLNPAGYTDSEAYGTNGSEQVGEAGGFFGPQAFLWSGTAASAVNLQSLLPTAFWTTLQAYSIDAAGNIYGTAYGTLAGVSESFAVEWSPVVPEPGPGSLFVAVGVGFLLRAT